MSTYSATSPEVLAFAQAVQDNRNCAASAAWRANGWEVRILASNRTKYIAIDETDALDGKVLDDVHLSGRFLVDRATGRVYTIAGYGRKGNYAGELAALTAKFVEATATFDPNARAHVERGQARVASWTGAK